MATVTMKAPGIGSFQYDTNSGISLPPGATQVSAPTQSNAVPKANIPAAPSSVAQTGTIPQANIPQAPDYSYRDQPWQDQLKMFQSNPDLAGQEWMRATNQANLYKATGDMDAYNKAQTWLNQIQTATGGRMNLPQSSITDPAQKQYQDYQNQMNELMTQLKSFAQPMQYNPATDPQALAYKQYYDNLAKQGSQNAMEEMNSRGLLNSSMTAGEIAKAEQDANLAYGTKVADLGQQFYQRQQDQFNNTAKLIGLLGDLQQRGLDNQHWNQTYELQKQAQEFNQGRQSKLDNLNAALEVGNALGRVLQPKEDWSNLYNQTEAPLNLQGQQFQNTLQQQQLANEWQVADKTGVITPALAQAYGIPEGTPTLQAKQIAAEIAARNASLGIEGMNANTSAARLAWEMNPNNPDNLYKQAEIKWRESQVNKNDNSKSPTSYKTDPNFAQDMQYVLSNPSDAANLLNSNAQAFISEYGTDGYAALRKAAGLD